MASDILSYNVVQDHEGIPIKGYRGLRPPGDLIYSYMVDVCNKWMNARTNKDDILLYYTL